jgi:hypothetical protein
MELPPDSVILDSVKELMVKHPRQLKSILNDNGKRQLSQLESDNTELRNCLRSRKEHLEEELKKNEALLSKVNSCKTRIRNLTSDLKAKNLRIGEFEKQIVDLQGKIDRVQELEDSTARLLSENAALKRSLELGKENARKGHGILRKIAAVAGRCGKELSGLFEDADGEADGDLDGQTCRLCLQGSLYLTHSGHEITEYTCVGGCGGSKMTICQACYPKYASTMQVCLLCRHPDSCLVPSTSVPAADASPGQLSAASQAAASAAAASQAPASAAAASAAAASAAAALTPPPVAAPGPIPSRANMPTLRPLGGSRSARPPQAQDTGRAPHQQNPGSRSLRRDTEDAFDEFYTVMIESNSQIELEMDSDTSSDEEPSVLDMLRTRRRIQANRNGTRLASGRTTIRPSSAGGYQVLSIRRTPQEPIEIPDSPTSISGQPGTAPDARLARPGAARNGTLRVTLGTPETQGEVRSLSSTEPDAAREETSGGNRWTQEADRDAAPVRRVARQGSPAYTPMSPSYNPGSPVFNPASPEINPGSPAYRPDSPDDGTVDPSWRIMAYSPTESPPTSPTYSPTEPAYNWIFEGGRWHRGEHEFHGR